jgi:SAM-dependent methyltransferase
MKKLDTYLGLCTEVYDLSKPEAPEDAFPFYQKYVHNSHGKILEPMCGTGRFLLPFLQEGYDITGFDASEHMLAALHHKAQKQGLEPTVWHGYIEQMRTNDSYGLIFIPCGSFGLLIDNQTAQNALKTFYNLLEPQGLLVFEIETPHALPSTFGTSRSSVYHRPDGHMIVATFFDTSAHDNILTTLCRYELIADHHVIHTEIEDFKVRVYEPEHWITFLKQIGFSSVYLRQCFNAKQSPGQQDSVVIYECRK